MRFLPFIFFRILFLSRYSSDGTNCANRFTQRNINDENKTNNQCFDHATFNTRLVEYTSVELLNTSERTGLDNRDIPSDDESSQRLKKATLTTAFLQQLC